MTDEIAIDYAGAKLAIGQAQNDIGAALALADEGRGEARAALAVGRPVFAALGGAAWYDAASIMLEAAASGAALGSTFAPVGTIIGGAVGALVAVLSMPQGIGVATYTGVCTLPDGSQIQTVNDLSNCLCFKQYTARKLTAAEASAEFQAWWQGTKRKVCGGFNGCEWILIAGYEHDRNVGIAPELTEANARAWWELNRRSDTKTRADIARQCLSVNASTAAGRAASEKLFDGRWGDRWYWGDEEIHGLSVREYPLWVPVSGSLVSRWLLLAASLGLGAEDVARIGKLDDPRIGVASQQEAIEGLETERKRAVLANAVAMVLARSGGVVQVAERGLLRLVALSERLGVEVGEQDIGRAWSRLADPALAYPAAPAIATHRAAWIVGGLLLVLVVWRFNRKRKR